MQTVVSTYPFVLSFSQEDTERILTERLHDLGGSVERGVELVDAQDTGIHVSAT